MKKAFKIIPIIFTIISITLLSSTKIASETPIIKSRNNNVCKIVSGDILVYVIFTKTKDSYDWKEYDLASTIDSLNVAINWIQQKAENNNIKAKLMLDYFGNDSIKSIYSKMGGSVKKLITNKDGIESIEKWGDKIAKISSQEKDKERLIAQLRDQNGVESVALIYMINNYFSSDYAISFNTTNQEQVEYSIISSKKPQIIAQEILHLFGAPYLGNHSSIKNEKVQEEMNKLYPKDIMLSKYQSNINKCEISDITKYYIGWADSLSTENKTLLKQAKVKSKL